VARRVVIIGAGLGGLSAACHLAGAGHDVTVVERGSRPGGRAGILELDGYRFDTGPTVLTMPELFERCFTAAGVEMSELLRLRPLDPMYRATFSDGSHLRVLHGREPMAEEIRQVCGATEAAAFDRFADWLTELYRVEMPNFIERNYDSLLDLARPLTPAIRLLRLGAFRRLGTTVARYFDDPRLQRLFSFQSLYAGLAPHQALAVYAVITYMDAINGVVVAEGGVHAVATAMATAAERAGAQFRYDEPAEQILTERLGGRVRAVRLEGGEEVAADAVVCNADMPDAYRRLLRGIEAPRVARRGHYSPSAVVWHVGVRGALVDGTAHHNIHFGASWRAAFDALLREGRRMPDPSTLVSVPTIDEPAMAPAGGHTLYVLEPVPNLSAGIDWPSQRDRIRAELTDTLARHGYPTDVEAEQLVDPQDWAGQGLEHGTPFSLSHRFFQSGPFRPSNVERRVPGLVFTGSSTVPGVGVPMVLVSGELAARRVEALTKDRR
jgi:phytoene desaturase